MPTPLGRNVHMAEDGATLIADINGLVTFIGGKINVEEIFTVPGDVDLKTGNVMFLGTVIVQGNVEDGFSVKASGNIEVRGSVGKCEIIAEGDIIIHQGVAGKGGRHHPGRQEHLEQVHREYHGRGGRERHRLRRPDQHHHRRE